MANDMNAVPTPARGVVGTLTYVLTSTVRRMTARERVKGLLIAIGSFVVGALEIVALASVMPVIALIAEPQRMQGSRLVQTAKTWLPAIDDGNLILAFAIASMILLVASALASLAAVALRSHFAAGCIARLGHEMYLACIRAPYPWHLQRSTAAAVHLFNAHVFAWGRNGIRQALEVVASGATLLTALSAVVLVTSLWGMLIVLAAAGLAFALLAVIRPRVAALTRQRHAAQERLLGVTTESLSGIKDVKLGNDESFVRRFAAATKGAAYPEYKRAVLATISPSVLMLLGQLALLGAGLAFWHVGGNPAEIAAELGFFVLLATRLIPALSRLSGNLGLFWTVLPSIEAIEHWHESLAAAQPPAVTDGERPAVDPAWQDLELVEVSFRYPGAGQPSLRGISAKFHAGAFYGVVGPSGAGKTTFVDIVLGLLEPSQGAVLLDGRPLSDFDTASWQACLGYVPQQPLVLNASLRENVALGVKQPEIDDARVRDCLRLAHLEDFVVNDLGGDLTVPLGDRGTRLSGGQRQRIALARALYKNARLVVLDEATGQLDHHLEESVVATMRGLGDDVTTIFVTHRLNSVRQCDRVFLLEQGGLTAEGGYDDLVRESELFNRLRVAGGLG